MAEPLKTLSDAEVEVAIAEYRASVPNPTRGAFLKHLQSTGRVAGWHRVTSLWGPDPVADKASEAARKANATRAAAKAAVVEAVSIPESAVAEAAKAIGPEAARAAIVPAEPVGISEGDARDAIRALVADLNAKFPERRDVIDGCAASLLAGEHALLLGPPGTAKSALIRAFAGALGLKYREHLLTAFTDPSEVFGALDVAALKEGRRRVITEGMFPEAEVLFADEIWKANSAILNSFLSLINERIFHNGSVMMKCPLVSLFAASNEPPADDSLSALYDRFFLRFEVDYLRSDDNLLKVFRGGAPKSSMKLSREVLDVAQGGAAAVQVSEETERAILTIRSALKAENIVASDRRWVQSLRMVKAVAWLDGESEACPEHLAFLADALWSEPAQKATVKRVVLANCNSYGTRCIEIVESAKEYLANVRKVATFDRGAALNEAAKANSKLDEMLQKLDQMANKATKKQKSLVADARREVEVVKFDLIATVKKQA